MTAKIAIARIQALGYSALQASFLWLVSLHSGVFLRRQYLQFAGISSGKHATRFLSRLIENGHCLTFPLAGRISVYHLHSKVIYRAIGQPDLRFRRPHGLVYVKTKLLALDFVLQNPQNRYLSTEQEKVDYFTGYCHVPLSDLPGKVYRSPTGKIETIRYFVDKFPLFLSPDAVVHFAFVSPGGLHQVKEFRTHLLRYNKLFQHLNEVRMVYIHLDSFHVPQAEACFLATLRAPNECYFESPGLLRYFMLRHAWERKECTKVNAEGLLYLNQSRKKYAASRYELLYDEWKKKAMNDTRTPETLHENQLRWQFLLYRINVDPRTFYGREGQTGDKPAESSFHRLVHPLCHQISFTTEG